MKAGVLLLNLGGPATLAEVRPFLFELFADPELVRLPVSALQKPLAWLLSTLRARRVARQYAQIGGGSPLRRLTEAQAVALQTELQQRGLHARVAVAMRYGQPSTAAALDQLARDGVTKLLALPLYPQFSVSTTGSSFKELAANLERRPDLQTWRVTYLQHWYDQPGYVATLAAQITAELTRFPDPHPAATQLLFSAHSVPQSYIDRGDPYLWQIQETVRLVTARLSNDSPAQLSFQSKVGPVKWLKPTTAEQLQTLAQSGAKQVLVIPIAFVSDHLETLYELDIQYRQRATQLGIPYYRRLPALNCESGFIAALADLACAHLPN